VPTSIPVSPVSSNEAIGQIFSSFIFSLIVIDCLTCLICCRCHIGDVRLTLAELADSLQGTFFRDYPLDLEILDFLPEDISFDWYRLMRDAIVPTLLTSPHLESGFISRRCEELLRAYQDASSLVYQHELEVYELRRHLEAARLCYLQQLSSCATFRSMGVSGGPTRLLV
jgi:hypothetical protein